MSAWPHPPYVMHTPRLLLRCFSPSDANDLQRVTAANREHLLPWIPWADREPRTVAEKVDEIRNLRGWFDLGKHFIYAMFDRHSDEFIGCVGLHPRVGKQALEVGYWITHGRQGEGLTTEGAAAMTQLALTYMGAVRVQLHTDPENVASGRVAIKLGYTFEGRLRHNTRWQDGTWRDDNRYALLRAELKGTISAALPVRGWDLGAREIALDE